MASNVFGRTNEEFPSRWLRLVFTDPSASLPQLVHEAVRAGTVLDISSNPALWGGYLRGTSSTVMAVGPELLENAEGEQAAHDSVVAHVLENLCALGREHLDFYLLRVRRPLSESQISGALIALEEARSEGTIKFVGLAAEDSFAAQSVLHLHDAFELLLVGSNLTSIKPLKLLAKSRRVAVVTRNETAIVSAGEASLIDVSSADQVCALFRQEVTA